MTGANTAEITAPCELDEDEKAYVTAVVDQPEARAYPSLYDSTETTIIAVVIGLLVMLGTQINITRMYTKAKTEHEYLTRFVTSLVGLVVALFVADRLIAGPDTALLAEQERATIMAFVKDMCLMIFSYYFGLKAQTPKVDANSVVVAEEANTEPGVDKTGVQS